MKITKRCLQLLIFIMIIRITTFGQINDDIKITIESVNQKDSVLTLINNSNKSIFVNIDEFPTNSKSVLLKDRKPIYKIRYYISNRVLNTYRTGYSWGDSFYSISVKSGESVFFNVPTKILKNKNDVLIPFSYKDEEANFLSGGVYQGVTFLWENINKISK
jgi:hypothetical protein